MYYTDWPNGCKLHDKYDFQYGGKQFSVMSMRFYQTAIVLASGVSRLQPPPRYADQLRIAHTTVHAPDPIRENSYRYRHPPQG